MVYTVNVITLTFLYRFNCQFNNLFPSSLVVLFSMALVVETKVYPNEKDDNIWICRLQNKTTNREDGCLHILISDLFHGILRQ